MLLWLAAISLGIWLAGNLGLAIGVRSIRRLQDQPVPDRAELPGLSIVIAARDEAEGVEKALRSVLALDYPGLELIVIDDRSTDGTSEILDRLARQHGRLHVIHNRALPAGWLGKNHALQLGADQSTGELLLFTDADVVFEPATLRRAVHFLQRHRLDHLAVFPHVEMPGYWTKAFFGMFALSFSLAIRPWRARQPRRREAIGIGAFNLVRRQAYSAIDGHRRLAMRPDDDMRLGQLLKRSGFRQDVLLGNDCVRVAWYPTVRAMMRGLEKNAFVFMRYSWLLLLPLMALHVGLNTWPWFALLLTSGPAWWLNLGTCVLMLSAWQINAPASRCSLKYALVYPVVSLLFAYTILRAAVLTSRQGGIRWRDTFYSLNELRGA